MKLKIIFLIAIAIIASSSCKKSKDSGIDYASNVVGTYGGMIPPGVIDGRVILSRQSNSSVNIDHISYSGKTTHYENATVSDGGSGKYNLSLTTTSMTINGMSKAQY